MPSPPEASSSGRSPEEQFRVVRKRNRVPLSCLPCRTRKKCDRGHPCSNCVKREGSDASTCSYAIPASRKKSQSTAASTPDDMQNRINRLENLVLSLMQNGNEDDNVPAATAGRQGSRKSTATATVRTTGSASASGPSPDSNFSLQNERYDESDMVEDSDSDDGLATSLGVLKVDSDKGKSMYLGDEHWHLLLAEVSEVKNYFMNHKKDLENAHEKVKLSKPQSASEGPTLLFGQSRATDAELRAGLPAKHEVLALIDRYYTSIPGFSSCVHRPSLLQQLEVHWQDPSRTSIMWLGMLYAILCNGMLYYNKVGDEPPQWKGRSADKVEEFRLRTVQCLIEADYTRPVEYTVETLMLYLWAEHSARWDADMALWMILSLVTKVAYRMGYHRDPKNFASLSPFQGEMRRRLWTTIRMFDVMFSYWISLPQMIDPDYCDTQLPSNLFDEDFGPESKVLPPSRPSTDATPMGYSVIKARLALEFGHILKATTKVGVPVSYETILRHDATLREIMEEMPVHLKVVPVKDATTSPCTLLASYNLDNLYHTVVCVLHRKFVPRARHNPRYAYSRRSAVEAAMGTLHNLAMFYREIQPGGRLFSMKTSINLAARDYLLPAAVVLMELHADNMAKSSGSRKNSDSTMFWTPEERLNMIGILEMTRDVWAGLADSSIEAFKASKLLELMIGKIRNPDVVVSDAAPAFDDDQAIKIEQQSTAPPFDMLQGGMTPNTAAMFGSVQTPGPINFGDMDFSMGGTRTGMTPNFGGDMNMAVPQSPFSMFSNVENNPDLLANFDWNAFENYTQNASWANEAAFGLYEGNGRGQP